MDIYCTLNLNEKEVKLLLSALGKRPFEEVYELIEKIITSTTSTPEINGKAVRPAKAQTNHKN